VDGWGHVSAQGIADWCRRALDEAGVPARAIARHLGGGNGVVANDRAEREALALLGRADLRPASLKRHLGDGLGFASAANLAWAADAVSRDAWPSALAGLGPGERPLGGAAILLTHVDFHGHAEAAVVGIAS